MDPQERLDGLDKVLFCNVNERCLQHLRLPEKDESGENRVCSGS